MAGFNQVHPFTVAVPIDATIMPVLRSCQVNAGYGTTHPCRVFSFPFDERGSWSELADKMRNCASHGPGADAVIKAAKWIESGFDCGIYNLSDKREHWIWRGQ